MESHTQVVKKIIFTNKEKIEVQSQSTNFFPLKPTEILLKNSYSHVSTGTELACLEGKEDWFTFPKVPGYSSVAEILSVGHAIKDFVAGDRVFCFGPHASHYLIDREDRWSGVCVKVPESLSSEQAAFAHMGSIAITALRVSNIELGDRVVVTGMGPIGILAAQLAQLQGATVMGIDPSLERLDLAKACGVQNLERNSTRSLKDICMEFTDSKGADTFIEASGRAEVSLSATACISRYGSLVLLGSPRASYPANLTDFLKPIHLWSEGSIEVKGALEFIFPTHPTEFVKHSIERNIEIILQLMVEGRLQVKPLLSHTCEPERASTAYHGLKHSPESYYGLLFKW